VYSIRVLDWAGYPGTSPKNPSIIYLIEDPADPSEDEIIVLAVLGEYVSSKRGRSNPSSLLIGTGLLCTAGRTSDSPSPTNTVLINDSSEPHSIDS
jgi:hypothetical protein